MGLEEFAEEGGGVFAEYAIDGAKGGEEVGIDVEFADVLAWLATIANVAGVDLTEAVMRKYGSGCPGCGRFVCTCPDAGKP